MKYKIIVETTYHCALEQAFKTPMLCDVSKVHTGHGLMPKVTHCTEDENWGQPGSSKKVFVGKSPTFKGGESSVDNVIERIENKYWKIEINNFKAPMFGFTKFEGEWETKEIKENTIAVTYTYTLYAGNFLLYPINWLIARLFWKKYMKHVLENIRSMIQNNEPYLYP